MTRLADDLRDLVEGEVRFAAGDRALYAAAGSNYRQVPIGVVIPKTIDDVVATVGVCRDHGAPVLSRGGGTSLAGQGVNVAVVMKRAVGMAPEREMPEFAPVTFQKWFSDRGGPRVQGGKKKIVLWPDTFTNHFHPEIGVAAVEVLEAEGYRVEVPAGHVCCGRPLYDYGMLDTARRYLERMLELLREDIRAGVPVVGLEPSCVAVFKDELVKMLPHDEDARRLSEQTFHFAEFLDEEGYEPPVLPGKALLHGHCHHKATGGISSEQKLLEAMLLEVEAPDSGCCGMLESATPAEDPNQIIEPPNPTA